MIRRVCVFCGAYEGERPIYAEAARVLGAALNERGVGLVYGGGNIGLMGIVADTVLDLGGEVIGVIPKSLRAREVAHEGLSELHVVEGMHERKALMAALSDAFVALPGGLGTLEELLEISTWSLLEFHRKPIALLNVDGYFDLLLAQLDRAVTEGFLRQKHGDLLLVAEDVPRLLDLVSGSPSSGDPARTSQSDPTSFPHS